jgi:hypothetical protein
MGKERAAFYFDGVRILENEELETKSYLLAPIAREIDGDLRDILSRKEDKEKKQEELKRVDLEHPKEGLESSKNIKGHVASITTALGCDVDSPFAVRWARVATPKKYTAAGAPVVIVASTTSSIQWRKNRQLPCAIFLT